MWKKVLVVGATTAAIVGAGTAALAVTGNSTPTPSASASGSTSTKAHAGKDGKHGDHRGRLGELRRVEHGTVTVKDAKAPGGFQTYDAIKGTVTAVSPSSITVRSADGTVETYAVTATTVVHTKADGKAKGQAGQISAVAGGDAVDVLGTGTTTYTATRIADSTH